MFRNQTGTSNKHLSAADCQIHAEDSRHSVSKTSDPPSRRGVSSVLAPRQESESAANRRVERVKKPLDDQSELARKPADGQTGKGTGGGK